MVTVEAPLKLLLAKLASLEEVKDRLVVETGELVA